MVVASSQQQKQLNRVVSNKRLSVWWRTLGGVETWVNSYSFVSLCSVSYFQYVSAHLKLVGGRGAEVSQLKRSTFILLQIISAWNLFSPQGNYIYCHGGGCEKGEESVKRPIRGAREHGMMGNVVLQGCVWT